MKGDKFGKIFRIKMQQLKNDIKQTRQDALFVVNGQCNWIPTYVSIQLSSATRSDAHLPE